MNIDQIKVGFRYRKDLGDLRTLAKSIDEVGLLHPVVVTPEGRLIAGQRRLEACRLIGQTDVPVTVVDLYQAAQGEAERARLAAQQADQLRQQAEGEKTQLRERLDHDVLVSSRAIAGAGVLHPDELLAGEARFTDEPHAGPRRTMIPGWNGSRRGGGDEE